MRSRAPAALLASLAVLPHAAAAQPDVGASNPDPTAQAVGGFLSTLVIGLLLVVAAPDYSDRVLERARGEPLMSFLWGLGVLVAVIGAVVVLAITVVGLVVAIPLLIVFFLVAVAGNVFGYLALFDGYLDDRRLAVVVAALLAGATSLIPVLGDLVGFVVGAVGAGAMVLHWRRG